MLKIRYKTPTGAVAETQIPKPETKLEQWRMNIYIHDELSKLFLKYKGNPQIIES